jgi:hypothetical protein
MRKGKFSDDEPPIEVYWLVRKKPIRNLSL